MEYDGRVPTGLFGVDKDNIQHEWPVTFPVTESLYEEVRSVMEGAKIGAYWVYEDPNPSYRFPQIGLKEGEPVSVTITSREL